MGFRIAGKQVDSELAEGEVFGVDHTSQVRYAETSSVLANDPVLTSSTTERTSYWIKRPDGTKRQLGFSVAVPMRNGHFVQTIYLGWADKDVVYPIAVFNRATKQLHKYTPRKIATTLEVGLGAPCGCLLSTIALCGLIGWPIAGFVKYGGRYGENAAWAGFLLSVALCIVIGVWNKLWFNRNLRRLTNGVESEILALLGFGGGYPPEVSVVSHGS